MKQEYITNKYNFVFICNLNFNIQKYPNENI